MAPVGRPYWKGFIKLSLVQIAVQIYSAVEPSSRLAPKHSGIARSQ